MNIALCTDENFTIPALVCITSILENNKEENCCIYVITDGISNKARAKFSKLSAQYGKRIEVLTIDRHRFDGLTVSDRYPVSMYYRFLLPEMLANETKVLYLDCDIIVRHSLRDVYETDLNNKAIGAVVSQSCDWVKWSNDHKLTTPFFNSGVLLMNLEYWRKSNTFELLVKWLADYTNELWLPDQSALNKVLEGKVVYLDYTYNFQEVWTHPLDSSYMHFSRWSSIEKDGVDPIIVHYCDAEKPWFIESRHKFKADFMKYALMYDFIEFKPIKRYSKAYNMALILDKIGLKFRYWAGNWQKKCLKKIRVS